MTIVLQFDYFMLINMKSNGLSNIFFNFFFLGGVYSVGFVGHFVFLRDVWLRTQRAAVASRHAPNLATHIPELIHPSP
jgi:hypothetical protein